MKNHFFSTGSTKARRYPLSYIFSGYYFWGAGIANIQGTYGAWWSTSTDSSTNAYYFSMYDSNLYIPGNGNKGNGVALRRTGQFFLERHYYNDYNILSTFTPPAQPKPAGIRFRIYFLDIIPGEAVTQIHMVHAVSFGLH